MTPYWIFFIKRKRERIFGKKLPLHPENNFATCREIIYLDIRPAQNQSCHFDALLVSEMCHILRG